MSNKNIKEILLYFDHYSNRDFKTFLGDPIPCKWHKHKKQSKFKLAIFEDGIVYQCDDTGMLVETNLTNLEEVKSRFESFTGEKLIN
tara:strand:- start:51365 stop:51625 length:261 start_codon:yes stop_codon:yes gene_type:complete